MKLIKTEEAVGSVLCHDITQIIPGVVKDAVFRKGHVVTQEDIPVLLSVGKEHLYVWEKQEGMLHENEAAEVLRRVCQGRFLKASKPHYPMERRKSVRATVQRNVFPRFDARIGRQPLRCVRHERWNRR